MGYRVVQIMPEFFFEAIMKEHDNKYSNPKDSDLSEFTEFIRVSDGLPKDAKFVEYRIKPTNHNVLNLVFESEKWSEENNFELIDINFESLSFEKERLNEVKDFVSDLDES